MDNEFNNNRSENSGFDTSKNINIDSEVNGGTETKNENITSSVPNNNDYNINQNQQLNNTPPQNVGYNQGQYSFNYNNQSTQPQANNFADQNYAQQAPQQNTMPNAIQNNPYYNNQQQTSPYYFYNGVWYYRPAPSPSVPKKKMSASMKVFLTVIFSILGIMLGTLIIICVMYGSNFIKSISAEGKSDFNYNSPYDYYDNNDDSNGNNYEDYSNGNRSNSENEYNDDDYPDYSNPNGPSIKLEKGADKTTGNSQSAFKKLAPSVVAITTYSDIAKSTSTSSVTGSTAKALSEGTGLIINEDGYIITNSHVINGSKKYQVTVTLDNSNEYDAKIVGYDQRTDLAVLKIDADEALTPCEFADSTDLIIGQDVIAIGNPGGKKYSNSITKGIISALDRQVNQYPVTFIQTDTAINPGNSGGPLANLDGKVIGITNIKVVDTQYEGMGFAIPSTTVKKIADDLIKNGKVTNRAILGITGSTFSSSQLTTPSDYADVNSGVYVNNINSDSPLNGKMLSGDVITEINNDKITNLSDLYTLLEKYSPGDEVTLTIYRPDKGNMEIVTTLMEG